MSGTDLSFLMRHWVVMGDYKFIVTDKQIAALDEGAEYCVYFMPTAKLIVSIEPMTSDDQIILWCRVGALPDAPDVGMIFLELKVCVSNDSRIA